jgi:molybdate transport system regulatory protein
MKVGARNKLVGEVVEIKRGTLMSQARIRIQGEITLSSVMTLDSLAELELKEGDEVMVLVKAVNVLLAKDGM